MALVTVNNGKIEYRTITGDAVTHPTLVLLHEGLGCVELWRDFPDRLAARLDAPALVYSRFGYGRSDGLPTRRTPRFMHEEALEVLPSLLDHFAIERPFLIGHSDGASIALIHAAAAGRAVAGLVLMAPHIMVEDVCTSSIARVRASYVESGLRQRLAKYHMHVDDAFCGWADTWLLPEFRQWSIEHMINDISAPMLLIQGENDEYGTLAQLDGIASRTKGRISRLVLPNCGHAPHRDQEEAVIDAVVTFTLSCC